MSVRKGDRSDGELQVLNYARMLRNHSFQLCSNEKVYPKSKRWCLAQPTLQATLGVAENIAAANVTSLKEGPSCESDYRMRRECQMLALQVEKAVAQGAGRGRAAGHCEAEPDIVSGKRKTREYGQDTAANDNLFQRTDGRVGT